MKQTIVCVFVLLAIATTSVAVDGSFRNIGNGQHLVDYVRSTARFGALRAPGIFSAGRFFSFVKKPTMGPNIYDLDTYSTVPRTTILNTGSEVRGAPGMIYVRENNKIFLYGGYKEALDDPQNLMSLYNARTDSWSAPTTSGDAPPARFGVVGFNLGRTIFVTLGGGGLGAPATHLKDVWGLDSDSLVYTKYEVNDTTPFINSGVDVGGGNIPTFFEIANYFNWMGAGFVYNNTGYLFQKDFLTSRKGQVLVYNNLSEIATPKACWVSYGQEWDLSSVNFATYTKFVEYSYDGLKTIWFFGSVDFSRFEVFSLDLDTKVFRNRTSELNNNVNLKTITDRSSGLIINYMNYESPGVLGVMIHFGSSTNSNPFSITGFRFDTNTMTFTTPTDYLGDQGSLNAVMVSAPSTGMLYTVETGEVKSFKLSSGQWKALTETGTKHQASQFHAASMIGSTNMYVFGGRTGGGAVLTSNTFGLFNTSTLAWSYPTTSGNAPSNRELVGMCTLSNNRLFVFGGRNGATYFNDVYVYTEATSTWSNTANGTPPQKLLAPAVACIGSKAYLYGGTPAGSDSANKSSSAVFVFDADTSTWSSVNSGGAPATTAGLAMTVFGSKLFVMPPVPEAGITYNGVTAFDTTTNTWIPQSTNGLGLTLAQTNYTTQGFIRLQAGSDGNHWYFGYMEGNVVNIRMFSIVPRTVQVNDPENQLTYMLKTGFPGDVFKLPSGTFRFPQPLNMEGSPMVVEGNGMTQTILDFQGNQGFQLIQSESNQARISKLSIRNTAGSQGSALQLKGSSPTVSDVSFINCQSTGDGGAVYSLGGSPTFTNVVMQNTKTTTGNGGAIYVNAAPSLTLNNVDIQDSTSAIAGGGVYLFRSTTTINGFKVTRGHSGDGGGLYMEEGTLTGTDLDLQYSTAIKNGGGLAAVDGTVSLTYIQSNWNNATGKGGGIFVAAGTTQTTSSITHAIVSNNRAVIGGGFVSQLRAKYTLTNVTLDHNIVTADGGGMQLGDRSTITMKSCNIRNNEALSASGGGIQLNGRASLTMDVASGISNRRNVINNNKAMTGAAMATQGTGHVTMSKTDVNGNTATVDGGGLSLDHMDTSMTDVNNAVFQSNNAQQGNGGGVIIGNVDKVQMTSNQFVSNTAAGNGGALYLNDVYSSTKYTLTGLQFNNNGASKDGGAMYFVRDQPLWQCASCSFNGNTATLYGANNATIAFSLSPNAYSTVAQNSTKVLNPAPQVKVADVYGRRIASDFSTVVTVEAVSNNIVLSGPTSTVAVAGLATFDGLVINAPAAGTYQIRFRSSGIGQPSAPIDIVIDSCRMGFRRLNSECVPCAPGTYNDEIDKTSCKDCQQGTFAGLPGALTCTPCPMGQATSSTRQTECTNCAAGKFAGATQTVTCQNCAVGKFSGDGAVACSTCTDGKFTATGGQAECQTCGAGTFYDPTVNTQGCISCPADSVVVNKTCECDVGFYGEYDAKDVLTKCTKCPAGAVCTTTGVRLATMGTKPGFWRASASSAKFDKCLSVEVCTGSTSGSGSACLKGHQGPLCDQCVEGYGKSGVVCEKCPDPAAVAFAMLGIFAAMLLVIAFLIRSTMKANERIAEGDVVLTTPMMKLLMNYMQLTSFCQSFDLRWPPAIIAMFGFMQNVSAPKLQISSLDCMFGVNVGVFYSKFILFMFVPVIVTVLPTVGFLVYYSMKKVAGTVSWQKTRDNIYVTVMVVLFMIHPSVTQRIFEMFSCVSIDNGARSVLASDVSIDCASEEHAGWSAVAGIFLVIYTIGIPLAGLVLLFKNRSRVKEGDKDMLTKFGFLYNGFERDSIKFYWEVAPLMIRKVVVLMIVVFLQTFGTLVQALAGVFVIFFALLLHIRYQPYESDILDNLESMSLVTSFTTLYFGLFFFVSDISVEWQGVLSFVIMATNIVTFVAIILFFLHYNAVLYATKIINKIRSWRGYSTLEAVKRGGNKKE